MQNNLTTQTLPTPKVSRTRKPDDMSLEEWQITLRRQFGREQNFLIKHTSFVSEFVIINPQSGKRYRVALRGPKPGDNFCSCPDFAVNTLGTCKHIEFTLAKLEKKRTARTLLSKGLYPSYSEVYLRYGPKREVVFKPAPSCSPTLIKLFSRYFDAESILNRNGILKFDQFLEEVKNSGHEIRAYDDTLNFINFQRNQELLVERVNALFDKGTASADFENLLKVPLYPYQCEGALFAARTGRCLIADEMGLGKTIQAIAAAEILARTVDVKRVLIVSPTSLKHQWENEIGKFANRSAEVIEGLLATRKVKYATDTFYKITNYDVIHRDLELIHHWKPDLIILDEAQRIKNWKTRTAQSVKKLVSDHTIVLTGTPLENRLEELHSIVEFVDRFHLGPLFRFLAEHQEVDETGKVVGYKNLQKINHTLKSVMIRRTKKEVLGDLPERLDKTFFVRMTRQQQDHHDENYEMVCKIVKKWRKFKFLSEGDQKRLMIFLQNMRMSCNSTYQNPAEDHGRKPVGESG